MDANAFAMERARVETNLRHALERGELQVHFQPKVGPDGRSVGVEALACWNSAELGWLAADRFIPIAEETGLIEPITEFVWRTACRQAVDWRKRGWPELRLAVKLSARLFRQPGLPAMIAEILGQTGLPPGYLELQISERAVVDNFDESLVVLRALKDTGVLLAIDDFATGYSSLSYLQRFPIDILTIDKSFVADIARPQAGSPIVAAIVSLGHAMRLKVVADGVESETQWRFLDALGCDEFQGNLFSRPLPAAELDALLAEGRTAA